MRIPTSSSPAAPPSQTPAASESVKVRRKGRPNAPLSRLRQQTAGLSPLIPQPEGSGYGHVEPGEGARSGAKQGPWHGQGSVPGHLKGSLLVSAPLLDHGAAAPLPPGLTLES